MKTRDKFDNLAAQDRLTLWPSGVVPGFLDWQEIKALGRQALEKTTYIYTDARIKAALEGLRSGDDLHIWELWSKYGSRVRRSDGRVGWWGPEWLTQVTGLYFQQRRHNQGGNMNIVRSETEQRRYTTVGQIQPGIPFRHPSGEDLYVRLCQGAQGIAWPSHVLSRGLSGEIACVNLGSGGVYHYRADKQVVPVDAEVLHKGDLL